MRNLNSLTDQQLLDVLCASKDATAIYAGDEFRIEFANDAMLNIWGKDKAVIGMAFEKALPELAGQSFNELLKKIWQTGESYTAVAQPTTLLKAGKLETLSFDFTFKAIVDANEKIYAILHTATEVSNRISTEHAANDLAYTQVTNEQLGAINEKYLASNDKFQEANKKLQLSYQDLNQVNAELGKEKLRTEQIVANTPVGLTILKGEDLVIETANAQILEIWSRNTEEVIGHRLLDVFPELESQQFPKLLATVLEKGETIALNGIDVIIGKLDGTSKFIIVDFSYIPLFNAEGKTDSVLVTVQDVTQVAKTSRLLKESENELKQLNHELEQSNKQLQSSYKEIGVLNEEYQATNNSLEELSKQITKLNNELSERNETLMHTEAGFRRLIAQAPMPMMLLKGDRLVVETSNKAMLEIIGKDASIIGKSLFEEMPELVGQPAA